MRNFSIQTIATIAFALFGFQSAFAQFCDQAQGTAGFPSDINCQNAICPADPFCCNTLWDGICAASAAAEPACAGCLSTGGSAFCDQTQATAGFPSDPACETAICAIDPFCCNTQWDGICAGEAAAEPACAGCLFGAVTPPANDLCADAIPLTCGVSVSESTINATTTGAPGAACGTSAALTGAGGVWYSFVGTGASVTLSTCTGTDYDSQIAVFTGTCGALTCVAGNDDACGVQSTVTFTSTLGTNYLVYVTGFGGNTGNFTMSNDLAAVTPTVTAGGPTSFCPGGSVTLTSSFQSTYAWSPTGGSAQSATVSAAGSYTVAGTINGCAATSAATAVTVFTAPTATVSGGGVVCNGVGVTVSVALSGTAPWNIVLNGTPFNGIATSPFTTTVTAAATYTVSSVTDANGCTGTSSGSAVVTTGVTPTAAFTSTTAALAASFTDASTGSPTSWAWTFGDGGTSTLQNPSYTYAASGTYNVCLTATNGCGSNQICQNVTVSGGIVNDLCGGAITVTCGQTVTGTTVGSDLADAPATCTTTLNTAGGIWYRFVGTGDIVTVSTCTGTAYDSKLGVFSGACGALTCVAGNDDGCGLQSTVTFTSAVGTTYFIYVTGFGANTGAFTMSITCVSPPTNDLCGGAIPLTCGTPVNGTTVGATATDAPATCTTALNTAAGVWYSFFGTGATVSLNTCTGTTYDSKIGVFQGPCASLTCIGGNDDACGLQSTVNAATTAGTQYFVYVTGFGTATGAFTLSNDLTAVTPTVTAGGPTTFCQGGSVTLTSSTANTYAWSPSGGTAQSATITTAGSYTVAVNDLNNCAATSAPTTVTVNTAPTATVSGGGVVCNGVGVTVSVALTGTAPWSIVLNGTPTTGILTSPFTTTVTTAGTYTVSSVSDATGCTGTSSGSATVTTGSTPVAAFTSTTAALDASFTDASTGTPTSWAWTFGDGGTSTLQNPTYTYAAGGTYNVCLTATNGCGSNQICQNVTVVGTVDCIHTPQFGTANAPTTPTTVTISTCNFAGEFAVINNVVAGQTYTFTSSIATDWLVLTDGTSSTPVLASGTTPITWTATFSGTVRLHISTSNACGTQNTCRTTTVTCNTCVAPPPPANDLCGNAIPLTCGVAVNGTTVNSTTTGALSPCTTTLNTAGGVWYSFFGTGAPVTFNTCTGTTYDSKIGVYQGPCTALTCIAGNDDATGCGSGLQSNVTANTTAGTQYFVYVTGFGTATGAFTLSNNMTPIGPTITAGGPTTFCQGGSVTLSANTSASYTWAPTGGTGQTNTVTTSGSYTVTTVDVNSCQATSLPTVVTVNPAPTATLSGGATICQGQTTDLTITLTGTGPWTVTLNDGTSNSTLNITTSPFTQTVSTAGTYTIPNVIDATTCTGTGSGTATVVVNSAPTASFTSVTNNLDATFTDASTGGPTTYAWDFGDGGTDNTANPAHTYAAAGTYTVCLTVTNTCGTDQDCQPVTVTSNTIPNDLCGGAIAITCGQSVNGTTTGADAADAPATCTTALNTAPGVWYTFTGTGDAVTVSTCGGAAWDTKIGVFTGPCATLGCVAGNDDACGLQSSVAFTSIVGQEYLIYVTGFGTNSGDFTLTLTCTPAPVNDLCGGALPLTCGTPVNGTTVGADASDAPATCTTTLNTAPGVWYSFFGTGAAVTLNTCTGTTYDSKIGVFEGPCTSLVCVGGNDDGCGLQSSVTAATTAGTQYFVYVTGFGTGTGAFTLSNDIAPTVPTVTAGGPIAICQGSSVTLTSSTANTYNWSPSGGTAQSATITTAGSYTVTVNDLNNCSATSTATVVTVNPAPTATLSGGGTACSGQTVDLTITTTGTGPWTVVMNDGSTNSTINVTSSPFTQAVSAAGNYSLVSVADASSCPGTVSGSATVTVTTSPTATISGGGQVCNGVGVDITGTFTGTGPWTVVLNDGLNDIPLPPIVTSPFTQNVTLPGTYTIVSVTDATSCPGTVSGSAIVTSGNGPTAAFTSAPTDLTVVFTDASTGSPTTWAWDFGDSNTSTQQNPTHTYTTAGTYNVCLTVTNNCGTNQICQSVTVTSASCTAAAGTISSSATACLVNGTATLTGTPGGNAVVPGGFATVYALSQGTNIVQVSAIPTFTVTVAGTYTLHTLVYNPADIDPTSVPLPVPVALVNGQLIQGGGTFCGSLDLVGATVTVVDAIVPTVTALGPVSFCQGGSVDIQSSTANSYSWTPSGNTQTITATATGTYSVTTVDANGCSATSNTIDVTVNSGPTADISGGGAICAGAGVDITGTLTGVGPWDVVVSTPGGPFPITGITASPYSQNVTVPGDYILISVSDASGCPGAVSGTATVTTGGNLPVASFTASANLLTVTFTDASTDATTYAWDFGDSGTSTSASPTHTYLADGTYNVCLTVTNSCGTDQFCQTVTVSSNACPVSAGTLNASAAPACLTPGQTVTLDATPSGNSIVPTGFQTLYLLVQGGIIQQTNTTPSFAVNANGIYTIHTFVYDPNTFSTATIQNGVTTVASVNTQLLQGGGALCASLALSGVNFNVVTPVVPVVTPQGPTDICPGDAVLLTSSTASQYLWLPNQATASFTHASAPGDYTVTTVDANGCIATSAPVVVTNLPVTTGIITANGNTLTVDQVTTGYQWFHNGDPIPGANDQSYDAVESGYYWVIYTDPNGCETSSDTIEFSYIGIEEVGFDYISVYPNPSGGQFTVAVGEAKEEITFIVTELTGRVLFRQTIAQMGDIRQEISLDVASGTYLLQVLNNDGRGTSSLIQVMR